MTEWKPVVDHPEYEVSNEGDVRSIRRSINKPRLLSKNFVGPGRDRPQVQIYSGERVGNRPKYAYVAHLVADSFLGGRDGKRVRYADGDPRNTNVENLILEETNC